VYIRGIFPHNMSWDFSVGIAMDRRVRVRFSIRNIDISLLHSFQTGSGTHLAAYPIGAGRLFPRGKGAVV
jgi:hypothetical protein